MSFINQTNNTIDTTSNNVIFDVPCDPSVVIGSWVRMSSGVAIKAQADVFSNSNVIGVVETKDGTTLCSIRFGGVTTDIFTGLNDTLDYYLSDLVAGEMTVVPPSNPGTVLIRIGQAFNDKRFLVQKNLRIKRT